jgi:hypothetical protein
MTATDGQTDNSVSNLYVIIADTKMFEARCDRSEYIFFAVRFIFFSLLSSVWSVLNAAVERVLFGIVCGRSRVRMVFA